MKRKFLLTLLAVVCALCCAIGLAACGGNTDNTVAVESITLSKTTLTLEIDGSETLTVTYAPENATDKTVTWSSSAPDIAVVDNAGKVTAKAAGNATVTATTANNKTATCAVTVTAPAPVAMTEAQWKAAITDFTTERNFSLQASENGTFAAAMKLDGTTLYTKYKSGYEDLFVKDGNDYYEYDKRPEWTDWNVYMVKESTYNQYAGSSITLVMTAAEAFSANYSAFTYSDGKYSAATLNVAEGFVLKDIEVTCDGTAISKVVCTLVAPEGELDQSVTIDSIGTTEITIPSVKYIPVESVTLDKTSLTLEMGEEATVTATVLPADANEAYVTWSSSNEKVIITYTGLITSEYNVMYGGLTGTATLTATTLNGKTATCEITVTGSAPIVTGSFYMVCKSENGWVPEQSVSFDFSEDGTCNMNDSGVQTAGKYVIEEDVVTLSIGADVYYATIDGKIMWLFENKADANDVTKSIQHFYNGAEISDEDRAKMFTVFGDGVISGDKPMQTLAGQTFVFYDVVCDGYDAQKLQQFKDMNKGMTIVFDDGVNATVTQMSSAVVEKCTYVQEGENIILTVISATYNGQEIEVPAGTKETFTYNGNELVATTQIDENAVGDLIFRLQSTDVSSEQWTQIFENASNFTVETYTDSGESYEAGKFDGSTLLYSNYDDLTILYLKDGNNYERYQTITGQNTWYKGAEEAAEYNTFIAFAQVIKIFKDDYNLFTYANGVYTLEQLTKDYNIFRGATYNKFTNVKVTFENGALTGMEFEATRTSNNTTIKVVIKDIGSTTITVPTEYTNI